MSKYDFYTAVRTAQTIIAENFVAPRSMQFLRDAEKLLYTDHKVHFTFRYGVELGNGDMKGAQSLGHGIPATNAYPTGQVGAKVFAKVTAVAGDVITMPTPINGKLVDAQWVVIASASRITDRAFGQSSIMMTMQVFAAICVDGWIDEDIAELVAVITGADSAEDEGETAEVVEVAEVAEAPADEVVAEQVDGIRCGECGADVSDTEDGWCECMDRYEGRPSRGHCATCGDELTHDSLCSCTLGVDMDSIGKPIASVADLRAYLAK